MMRVAIYTRVSTRDKGQDPENQRRQLHEYIERQAWTFVEEFTDMVSGSTTDKRNDFKRMMEDAGRRRFNVVLVWALDRFTREGVSETFQHIARLKSYGVEFESYTESHFRTTGPAGELMIAVAAWIAKQERVRMKERINAGIARASICKSCRHDKHKGAVCLQCECAVYESSKQIGQAPLPVETREAILSMRGKGSVRQIAAKLGVSKSFVQKVLSTKGVRIVASALDETRVAL